MLMTWSNLINIMIIQQISLYLHSQEILLFQILIILVSVQHLVYMVKLKITYMQIVLNENH